MVYTVLLSVYILGFFTLLPRANSMILDMDRGGLATGARISQV